MADDGVCLKAKEGFGPLRNIVVRNVSIRSKSHAIKFGSNCDTEMSDILFENIIIWDSNSGLGIQHRSQGDIHNVTYRHIRIETRYVAPRWWGNGDWLSITAEPRHQHDIIGELYDLTFENIFAVSENGGLISSKRQNGIHGLVMQDIRVVLDRWSNYSMGQGPKCQHRDFPGHYSHGSGRGRSVRGIELTCMGTQDHRPSFAEDVNCSHYCRTPAKADGLYLENVHDTFINNFTVDFIDDRVPYWGDCLVVDKFASEVTINGIRCKK